MTGIEELKEALKHLKKAREMVSYNSVDINHLINELVGLISASEKEE